jgi:carbon-monoxide dehydrogenase large subunit
LALTLERQGEGGVQGVGFGMTATVAPSIAIPAILETNERRIEGYAKVSGQAQFAADFSREGMLWAAFTKAPHAHARIVSVDTTAAREMPGVQAVLTGADIGEKYYGMMLADWCVLAVDRVRFVGEYVAAVAATTREQAEAAAAAIDVVYEELPPILDTEAAIAPDAALVHEDDTKYTYGAGERPKRPHPNMQAHDVVVKGDPDAAMARASHVYERFYETPRYHGGYLEPRATLVWIDDADAVHVQTTNKIPFALRDVLARTFDLPKEKVIIEPNFVGGDFGAKMLTVEEIPLYFLARATKRPVKHVRTHADDVRSSNVRHAAKVYAKVGVDADGIIAAIDLRVLFDGGAYAAAKGIPGLQPGRVPKIPYRIAHARVARSTIYTNTIPGTFVRAPGDVQILFGFESLIDEIASDLHIDPMEFRLRNAVRPGDGDLEGNPYAKPRAVECLTTLRDAMGWNTPPAPGRGRGIALSARHIAGGSTSMVVTAHPDGSLTVETGAVEPGVGQYTVIQRVLAAELGIDPERISVTRGNTNEAPRDPGIGGSKGTLILTHAAADAARKLRAELALNPNPTAPIRVVGETTQAHKPGEPMWVNFCAYGVELSVDRETGTPTIHQVTMVADVGAIINPIAHKGQVDGGFLMGLGHALTEELHLEDGRIANIAMSDYKFPCQLDMPPFEVIYLPADGGPGYYGARAAGEFNTATVPPAIANAIADACGARIRRLALTSERILAELQAQASA